MTLERIGEIQQLAVQGLSAAEAAHVLGMTKNQVIGAAYRNGIIFCGGNNPKMKRSLCERIRTPCRQGHSRRDAFVCYNKKRRLWVVTCRTCQRNHQRRYAARPKEDTP